MDYKLPSGMASIETTGGSLPTIEYRYPQTREGIENSLREALEQLIIMEQTIKCAEDCGYSR